MTRLVSAGAGLLTDLVDLVLPADCAGCGQPAPGSGVCPACAEVLAGPPVAVRPSPVPAGLPPCFAAAEYAGAMRELILAYKEHGQRALSRPLGDALANVVRAAWPVQPGVITDPLALVPVPATAAAIRARHGDHMVRLARRAALTLSDGGCPAIVAPALRARPKDDSAHLNREQRAAAAKEAFTARPGPIRALRRFADTAAVVVVDDILTTGSTISAIASRLLAGGVPVAFGVTLAATRLRGGGNSMGRGAS